MCGRFALDTSIAKIKLQFGVDDLAEISPRYNISPGQDILFLYRIDGANTNSAMSLRWGLIPFWAKDKKIGNKLTNTRAETIAEKPAFRQSFKSKRGIIIMSGFFEWQNLDTKQPYYIKNVNDDLLAVAAIWDVWHSPENEIIQSCSLITTDANKLMSPIHNRMPVLLTKEEMNIWMNNTQYDKQLLLDILKPYQGSDLESYPVTTKMNNSRFNLPEAIERLG